jgi:hypothetical protein
MGLKRLTIEEMVAAFGNPWPYVHSDGTVDPDWERKILGYATMPAPLPLSWDKTRQVARFKCHKRLVLRFEAAFQKIHVNPYVWDTIGDFGGCYAFRTNRKNHRLLSMHAWAAAIDIDVADNQQGDTTPEVHPDVIAAFESEGFAWGGFFAGSAVDGMHFEFADLSRLT